MRAPAGVDVDVLLRTQVLHAAARQLASASSALDPGVRTTGAAGPATAGPSGSEPAAGGPAAVAVPSYRRHLAAQQLDDSCYLLYAMARVVHEARRASATDVLLGALAESRVLDHAGRLMLLITPPVSPQGRTDTSTRLALAVRASAFGKLVEACVRLAKAASAGQCQHSSKAEHLRDLAAEASDGFEALPLGRCGRFALLAGGVKALHEADGRGYYGRPLLNCLLVDSQPDPATGAHTMLRSVGIRAFTSALDTDRPGPARCLSRRAATALRLRLGWLALASLRAAAGFQRPRPGGAPGYSVRVHDGVGAGQTTGAEVYEYNFLLLPQQAAETAARVCVQLCRAIQQAPDSIQARGKAVAFWRLVVGAALYAAPRLDAGEPLCRHLAEAVQGHIDSTLALPPTAGCFQYQLPPIVPALVAAALAGGLIPGLEALLRRCGDQGPRGGQVAIADRLLTRKTLSVCFPWAFRFGEPQQATALVTSVAKLLRRCSKPLEQWPHQAVAGCTAALGGASSALDALGPRAAGPTAWHAVEHRAANRQHLAPTAFAVTRLLPEASRLVREGAAEALAQAGSGGGAPSAAAAAAVDDLVELATSQCVHWWLDTLTCAAFAPTSAPPAAAPPLLPFLWAIVWAVLSFLGLLLVALVVIVLHFVLCLVGITLFYATHLLWSAALLILPRRLREAAGPRPPWTPAEPLKTYVFPLTERLLGWCFEPGVQAEDASAVAAAAPEWRRFLEEEVAVVPLLGAVLSLLELRGRKPLPSPSTATLGTLAAATCSVAAAWPQHVMAAAGGSGRGPRALPWRPEGLRLLAWHLESSCSNPACINLAGDSEGELRLQQCKQCGRTAYCCRECQVAHWRTEHKEACKGTAAPASDAGARLDT
ncbi:hypothetical protein HYH03_000441 [Edaphochlamys debaryana]|uniref:phytol kinase n=1 Tax=Edaphochlamys debaryana TaxID=47281 RepID=A0A836C774_9CHLO|nr:hypothetical protein HYH03_000441 [Edaphochlamys debaryana]|eukprot:KAG2501943.1 hypothetical protein HYH03_000441 [Edaphochlamys debaryana]